MPCPSPELLSAPECGADADVLTGFRRSTEEPGSSRFRRGRRSPAGSARLPARRGP
ncbi:hypothetical protein ACFFX0_23830 [Citricoccus parietis]|uniref:Uncharacterized protein n=1 Tax=Citricoccus parietis TaxID=592307 RepID=A0ABV5FSS8_9MICC